MKTNRVHTAIEISDSVREVIEQVADVAGFLWERGWAEANGGNISVDVTSIIQEKPQGLDSCPHVALHRDYPELAGGYFVSTGTWTRMREVNRDWTQSVCIARVAEDGHGYHVVWRGAEGRRPTSELNSHFGIHQTNRRIGREATAVVHTHPDELIALSHLPGYYDQKKLDRLLWSMVPESVVVIPEGIGLVPYRITGSPELEAATAEYMESHRVCIWEKHGCVATGRDAYEAFDLIDVGNKCARLVFLCLQTGMQPEGLTDDQVRDLRKKFFGTDG